MTRRDPAAWVFAVPPPASMRRLGACAAGAAIARPGDRRSLMLVLAVSALLGTACGWRDSGDERGVVPPELAPITLPELARVDAPVEAQIREKYAAVTQMAAAGTAAPRDLGNAYGEYGMLLHAAEYHEAATPAYLNAQALVPDDRRWPYYLAQLYRSVGDTAAAMAAFRRVLELQPDDVPSLVWLGRMRMDQGQPDLAEPLFARAQSASRWFWSCRPDMRRYAASSRPASLKRPSRYRAIPSASRTTALRAARCLASVSNVTA